MSAKNYYCHIGTLFNKKLNITQEVEVNQNPSYHYINDFIPRMSQEGINYPTLISKLENNFAFKLKTLSHPQHQAALKISSFTQMIYLFKEGASKSLSENNIEKIIRTTDGLNKINNDYQHYFWTNNATNISPKIKALDNLKVIDDFSEFTGHKLYHIFNELLNEANKALDPVPALTQASDILRLMIIQKYGGIYHDVDYEIFLHKLFDKLTHEYSLILTQESSNERDVANFLIASAPGHEVINTTIDEVYRNFNNLAPAYVKYSEDKINLLVYETGPCALSVGFFRYAQNNPTNDDYLFFIKGGLTNHELARSTEPLNEKCKNENNIIIPKELLFANQTVPNIGADTMCGSWGNAQGFDKQLKYYSIIDQNDHNFECGSWSMLPNDMHPSDYSLSLNGEDYICGF